MTSPLELPDSVVGEAVPDDDIVLAYVTRGAMARYVEGVAARNGDFREELRACIDGLEVAGEPISAAARAWREPAAVVVPIPTAPRPGIASRGGALRRWAPLVLAAGLVLALGGYHRSRTAEAERVQQEKERNLAESEARLMKLQAELKEQAEAVAAAEAALASARSEADRAAAEASLKAAQSREQKTAESLRAGTAAGRPKASGAKAACQCKPGDPLCSCL